jgi:hypothetical protein
MEAPQSKYSAERAPGREHIPLFPPGFVSIRIVQLGLNIVILGLSAYGVSITPIGYGQDLALAVVRELLSAHLPFVAERVAFSLHNYSLSLPSSHLFITS